jgi:hypothetical protein
MPYMANDHSEGLSLDDERRARVKDCLKKDDIPLPPERFELFVRQIARTVFGFPTPAPGTFRSDHDAVRSLWQLTHDDDASPGQIRARIQTLPTGAIDYLNRRAPRVLACLVPSEKCDVPFQIWAASAEREKLIAVARALTEEGRNVVAGRGRGNGNRSAPRMEPLIMGEMRGAGTRHHWGGRPKHEEQQELIMWLAMDWLKITGQPPKSGRSDQTGFGDLCHCVFQWLGLPDGSATQALRQYWDTIKQYRAREPLADFLKRHGEEF